MQWVIHVEITWALWGLERSPTSDAPSSSEPPDPAAADVETQSHACRTSGRFPDLFLLDAMLQIKNRRLFDPALGVLGLSRVRAFENRRPWNYIFPR